jgi:hypothetical protein
MIPSLARASSAELGAAIKKVSTAAMDSAKPLMTDFQPDAAQHPNPTSHLSKMSSLQRTSQKGHC